MATKPSKKMKLTDLQPGKREVDYTDTDIYIYEDCRALMAHAYLVSKVIVDAKITDIETIDEYKVRMLMKRVADDQTILSQKYQEIVNTYEEGKKKNPLMDTSDYHFFKLQIGQDAHAFMQVYMDTVFNSVNDLFDYVNNNLPDDRKLEVPELPQLSSTGDKQ